MSRKKHHISETMCSTDANRNVAFKSLDPSMSTQEDIDILMGGVLTLQHMFAKRTSPWEMAEWPGHQLENFRIETKTVERLYHISHFDDGVSIESFKLVVRVLYRKKPVYAILMAVWDYMSGSVGGKIYVSLNAQIFLKSILCSDSNPHDIWASMVEDGLKVEEPSDFDFLPVGRWRNVPRLTFLCHMNIVNDERLREAAARDLPKILADSVEDFLREMGTRDHFKSFLFE
nr:MAG: hypothetical protein [Metapenaeus ensis nimavirus]